MPTKILFICMGNICRSPAAEGIMQAYIERDALTAEIELDSCGTGTYHVGCPADARMQKHAKLRSYDLTSISRQFVSPDDFDDFDHLIVMDGSNYENIKYLARHQQDIDKIQKLTDFCEQHDYDEVPDPYFGGDKGFELVLDIIEDGCTNLLKRIRRVD